MTGEEIRNWLRRRPFQPFRVVVKDGRTFEIHHAHLCLVSELNFFMGFPTPGDTSPEPLYDDFTSIPPSWVEHIEALPVPSVANVPVWGGS